MESAGLRKRHLLVLMCFAAAFVCYIDRVNISIAIIPMAEHFGWSATEKGFVLSSFSLARTRSPSTRTASACAGQE